MKIAIVGAGAIGSTIAGHLLEQGKHEVSLLARGPHLEAIKANGLTLRGDGRVLQTRPFASDKPADLGPQDLVITTVKAHGLTTLAPQLSPLLNADTRVVAVQNGIPWWYFYGADVPEAGTPFPIVDPDGVIWRSIGPERVIGCSIYVSAALEEPGVAAYGGKMTIHFGAPRPGDHAPQIAAIADTMKDVGLKVFVTDNIRNQVWIKLLRNIAFGPTSVLTGGTSGLLHSTSGMKKTISLAMHECIEIARAWGIELEDTVDAQLTAGSPTPMHKSSMLQDFEAGRPLELDAVLGSAVDLAARRGVPVPQLESFFALVGLRVTIRDHGTGMTNFRYG